jgi:hypothetical protein
MCIHVGLCTAKTGIISLFRFLFFLIQSQVLFSWQEDYSKFLFFTWCACKRIIPPPVHEADVFEAPGSGLDKVARLTTTPRKAWCWRGRDTVRSHRPSPTFMDSLVCRDSITSYFPTTIGTFYLWILSLTFTGKRTKIWLDHLIRVYIDHFHDWWIYEF